jgi:hypothetical protein
MSTYPNVIGGITTNTTIDAEAYKKIQESGNMSRTVREIFDTWVEAGAPVVPAPYYRTNLNIGCYFPEDDYYTLRAYSMARNGSIAKTLRTAIYWYYYHRG